MPSFIQDMLARLDEYGRKHREHMTSQWVRDNMSEPVAQP